MRGPRDGTQAARATNMASKVIHESRGANHESGLLYIEHGKQAQSTLMVSNGRTACLGFNLHFSPRGEAKWVRGPSGRGASR